MASRTSLKTMESKDRAIAIKRVVFTRWINKRLAEARNTTSSSHSLPGNPCGDVLEDLREGFLLLDLLEAISGVSLKRNRGNSRAHFQANVAEAFSFLEAQGIDYTGITNMQILDGDPTGTLGLVWAIIRFYNAKVQSNIGKRELISWFQNKMTKCDVKVTDLGKSWKDGLAFGALIASFRPDLLDLTEWKAKAEDVRLDEAFRIGQEEFGVEKLLEPEDFCSGDADEHSVLIYLSEWHHVLKDKSPVEDIRDLNCGADEAGEDVVKCQSAFEKFRTWLEKAEVARDELFGDFNDKLQNVDDYREIFNLQLQRANLLYLDQYVEMGKGDAAGLKDLQKRFEALENLEFDDLLEDCETYYDDVLQWITQADHVSKSNEEVVGRERSPQSQAQDLLERLPRVRESVSSIEEGLKDRDSQSVPNPRWLTAHIGTMAITLDRSEAALKSSLEESRRFALGDADYKETRESLERKIAQVREPGDVDANIFDDDWFCHGDELMSTLDQLASDLVRGVSEGKTRRFEDDLTLLREAWIEVRLVALTRMRTFEFERVKCELEKFLNEADDVLEKSEKTGGPLEAVRKQREIHETFFSETNFASPCEALVSKLAKDAEPRAGLSVDFTAAVTTLRTRFAKTNESAAQLATKLDEDVEVWEIFIEDMQEIVSWLEQNESHILQLENKHDKSDLATVDSIEAFRDEVQEFQDEVTAYGKEEVMVNFRAYGEQLAPACADVKLDVEVVTDRYEKLVEEVQCLQTPVEILFKTWTEFLNISVELDEWIVDANALLEESDTIATASEAEAYAKRHRDFFAHHKIQNSKLSRLSQLLDEIAAQSRQEKPAYLAERLAALLSGYDCACALQKTVLEEIEFLIKLILISDELNAYFDRIETLLGDLACGRGQEEELTTQLDELLQEMTLQQEKVGEAGILYGRLQGRGLGDCCSSPDEMRARLETVKRKQDKLFERRELDEEAREFVDGVVEKDLEKAEELVATGDVECDLKADGELQKKFEDSLKCLETHADSVQSLVDRLAPHWDHPPTSPPNRLDYLRTMQAKLQSTIVALKNGILKCQEVTCFVQGFNLSLKIVCDYVERARRALGRDSARECRGVFSDDEVMKQRDFLASAVETLEGLHLLAKKEKVVPHQKRAEQVESELESVIARGATRVKEMQVESLMREAEADIRALEASRGNAQTFEKALKEADIPREKLDAVGQHVDVLRNEGLSSALVTLKGKHSRVVKFLESGLSSWLAQRALVDAVRRDIDSCQGGFIDDDVGERVEIAREKVTKLEAENAGLETYLTDVEVGANDREVEELKAELSKLRGAPDVEEGCNMLRDWLDDKGAGFDAVARATNAADIDTLTRERNYCSELQDEMAGRENELNELRRRAEELRDVLPESQQPGLEEMLGDVTSKWAGLEKRVKDRLSLVKASAEKLISEVEVVANMETWLDEKKRHFREIQRDQAEEKLDELEVLSNEVRDKMDQLEQSPDDSAPDLLDRFFDFGKDVEEEIDRRKRGEFVRARRPPAAEESDLFQVQEDETDSAAKISLRTRKENSICFRCFFLLFKLLLLTLVILYFVALGPSIEVCPGTTPAQ